jgi:photosystem II stability/assembly factor-like uncharacterized protein
MMSVRTHSIWPRLIGLAALVGACAGTRAAMEDSVPTSPAAVPAARVSYAGQAMMLGATRAGARLVAVGDHGVVLLSDDGGRSHRQATSVPIDFTLTSVSFADSRRGWAVGHGGVILHTRDGGETWSIQRTDTSIDRPLFAVHFFDDLHGVAVGLWSLVLTTDDGGVHWENVTLSPPEGAKKADLNLLSLFASPRGVLFAAAEHGMVLRSDDLGKHWQYLPTGYNGSFWTGIAAPGGVLVVAGLRGSLYRSTDEGRSWQRVDTHSQASITALTMVGDRLVGVGADGLVLSSEDGGASFQASVRSDRMSLTSVATAPDGRPVLYSRQGVVNLEVRGEGR